MSSISDLSPGDIGFGPLNSRGAKLLVDAGQLMLGEGFRVGRLNIEHVFVVVQVDSARRIWAVEAMPSGARHASMGGRFTPEYAYVRLPEDYPGQAQDAAAIARAMIGTPYSFASYAALAAWKFGMLRGKKLPDGTIEPSKLERWIDRRKPPVPFEGNGTFQDNGTNGFVSLPAEAICSVLADQAWSLTGKKIMQGVAHQCVTPGALAMRLLEMSGTQWMWPA